MNTRGLKERLSIIISELLQNRNLLQKEIDDCLLLQDYEGAHFYENSLRQVNSKLNTLNRVYNPNYDKIRMAEWRLKRFRSKAESHQSDKMSAYYNQELRKTESTLRALKNEQFLFRGPSRILSKKLIELAQKKISKIELLHGEVLLVSLDSHPETDNLSINLGLAGVQRGVIDNNQKIELRLMGFQDVGEIFLLEIIDFDISKIEHVLIILSRIMFDVISLYSLDKPVLLNYE